MSGACVGKTEWRDAGLVHATDDAGLRFVIKTQTEWHDVATYADTGQRWQDSGFKRYRLADGSAVAPHGEDSFLIVVSGTVLRPSRLTLNRKPAAA